MERTAGDRRLRAPTKDDADWSLLEISGSGIEATTAFAEDGSVVFRLFNAEGDATPKRLTVNARVTRAQLMELDGRTLQDLPVEQSPGGTTRVTVTMPRFAVRTLRCEFA